MGRVGLNEVDKPDDGVGHLLCSDRSGRGGAPSRRSIPLATALATQKHTGEDAGGRRFIKGHMISVFKRPAGCEATPALR